MGDRNVVPRDIAETMRLICNDILDQISDDIRYNDIMFDEYHIHDFANQKGRREKLDQYLTRIGEESPGSFHIIIINADDWRRFGYRHHFPIGSVERLNANVIIACTRSQIEEDDIVCLRLFDMLTYSREFRYIQNRNIIIRTDDDMTSPQHELLAVAHRYYNSFIEHVGEYIYDRGLQEFFRFLSGRCVGKRGDVFDGVEDMEYDPEEQARRDARTLRFGTHHGGNPHESFKNKYLKYKQKYLELKNN